MQGIFRKENTDKALKYGIYRHLPTYEKIIRNLVSFFTKKQIYTQVWEQEYAFDDNNIMSFISKLRKKIEPNPERPFYILTVRGVGYRFNKEA